jgi:hypothetical protein
MRRGRRAMPQPSGERLETVAGEERLIVIANRGGRIEPRAIFQLDTGTFLSRRPEPNELHKASRSAAAASSGVISR